MNTSDLKELLESVKSGHIDIDDAVTSLRHLSVEDLGFARIDHHRPLRKGFPEVIFAQGKTPEQTAQIFARLAERNSKVLATRATSCHYQAVSEIIPDAEWHEDARIIRLMRGPAPAPSERFVSVLTAGTSDLPVAREAAVTLETLGTPVRCANDVGVAGLHRLLELKDTLYNASALIVVAGMEGALPSVVGGLVDKPVIAVPTSIGYGASFQGLAALLGMLNTCASGVAVMNIDNGFGAAFFAHLVVTGGNPT